MAFGKNDLGYSDSRFGGREISTGNSYPSNYGDGYSGAAAGDPLLEPVSWVHQRMQRVKDYIIRLFPGATNMKLTGTKRTAGKPILDRHLSLLNDAARKVISAQMAKDAQDTSTSGSMIAQAALNAAKKGFEKAAKDCESCALAHK